MVRRTWKEDEKIIHEVYNIDNKFIINLQDFEHLYNLYKFIYKKDLFIDRKRNKAVATIKKDLLRPNNYIINFNQDWLLREACDTNSETVIKIMKSYPELTALYQKYKKYYEESNKRFKKWIASYSLLEDGDDCDEEFI